MATASAFWKNASVLVTGAHGFTGSHLCRDLCGEGAKVRALVKKGADLSNLGDLRARIAIVEGDVTEPDSLAAALKGVQYVFNPAAIVPVMEARRSPQKCFTVNGIGAFNVASAALAAGARRILHVSTCHVYGNLPEAELPIRETATPRPGDLYAASKYAAEIYLKPLIDEGAPIFISRAFAKYGPGQGAQYLVPRIITQLLKGEKPKLGNPKPTRDYSHIADIARGYRLIMEKGRPGEIYHLSSEKETSVGEMYETLARLTQSKFVPEWNYEARPQDILRLFGKSDKARRELGWKPEIPLEQGLSQTVEWWRRRLS